MTGIIFSSIIKDLKTATESSDHPFRHFTLATSSTDGTPRMRTVVLRDIDDTLNLMIYTDKRSKKTTHIHDHNSVSLLFTDAKRFLQISILAKAEIISNNSMLQTIWEQIPQKSRKDYSTQLPPGQEISNPAAIDYLEGAHFFSAIKFTPHHIEYLRLKRPDHIRVAFKKEYNDWNSSYLVP
ncbi:pyridoxamine 5'-phosphate oxidase family protein [Aquimarina aquimarini]|uniref:pyridoxamine 5'-phosphate oxidase family protein n=1 Tax=Aquimarina aquimarini TaxID=1191734 RepID=UPI000D55FB54|nr:pyridoxamine 5'-phosphate oxidase family protein [Aquimarina aquimarini]